jgi:hypothetical protein
MSLLSKSELQFLQGQKQVSKSYEYKLKSIIKRKVSTLLEKELPLLSCLFPNLDLTKNSKEEGLSSRRSRVQIPAGASVILNSESNLRLPKKLICRIGKYTKKSSKTDRSIILYQLSISKSYGSINIVVTP